MRLDAMRSFCKLVEAGSYAAAADALYMSATTLHSHVKTLEEELSTTLVTFDGRRMKLTRAGTKFLLFAERTLSQYHVLREEISGLTRPSQATLRVVSLPALGVHLVPPVVAAFQRDHPDVHVVVDTRFTGEAIAALVSRQADLAIIGGAHAAHLREVFDMSVIFEDRLVAILRKDLYCQPDMSLLDRYPLATQPSSTSSRQYVERWAREQGITFRVQYEHTSFDGILTNVMANECIGIVGGYLAALGPLAGMIQVLDLPSFEHVRQIVALHPPRTSEAVSQFVQCFRGLYDVGPLIIDSRVGGDPVHPATHPPAR
ncbi:MAG: LysR family transcriptional regulator [Dehalococcoidia bacterium]